MRARPGGEVGTRCARGSDPAPRAERRRACAPTVETVSASALQPTPCVTRGRLQCEVQFAERDSSWRLFNYDSVLL